MTITPNKKELVVKITTWRLGTGEGSPGSVCLWEADRASPLDGRLTGYNKESETMDYNG